MRTPRHPGSSGNGVSMAHSPRSLRTRRLATGKVDKLALDRIASSVGMQAKISTLCKDRASVPFKTTRTDTLDSRRPPTESVTGRFTKRDSGISSMLSGAWDIGVLAAHTQLAQRNNRIIPIFGVRLLSISTFKLHLPLRYFLFLVETPSRWAAGQHRCPTEGSPDSFYRSQLVVGLPQLVRPNCEGDLPATVVTTWYVGICIHRYLIRNAVSFAVID